MWNVLAVDAKDWLPFAGVLPVSGWSWKRSLNAYGAGSWIVETKDAQHPVPEQIVSMLMRDGWRTLIVLQWGERVVYAGFVTEIASYDLVTGTLELRTRDLRAMLEKRGIMPVTEQLTQEAIVFDTDDTVEITRRIARNALSGGRTTTVEYDWQNVPSWKLPVWWPSVEHDTGVETRVPVRGRSAEDLVSEWQSMAGGPDIDFQPSWIGGTLQWTALVEPDPHVHDVELHFDPHPGSHSQVVGLRWAADFTRQVTGVTAIGGGQGKSMLLGHITSGRAGMPGAVIDLEESVSVKQSDDQRSVDSLGIAELRKRRRGTKQFSFDVQTDDIWDPTWFRPGVHVHIHYPGDPGTAAGDLSFLVLSVSGDESTLLGLEVQLVS